MILGDLSKVFEDEQSIMEAVENNEDWALRFPDTENYTEQEMADYNELWPEIGDVREWETMGYGVRTYRTIPAAELWNLINICATYSAEPGIFFIDNANNDTNAKAYGQKVVATNPCGEQPLAGYSVCNLAAVNLAEHVSKDTNEVEVASLNYKKILIIFILSLIITAIFYVILKALNTSSLIISTISITTSFIAVSLTFFRSPYYALAYATNDIVLIVLWIIATLKNASNFTMILCFIVFLINDIYGFINWKKIQNHQK